MGLLDKLFKSGNNGSTLILDTNGKHTIGGKAPSDLVIPELETSPMVHFGQVKKNEPAIELLDFDLHMICPIFLNLYDHVFFDYSNPLKPILIRENVKTDFSQYFKDIPASTYIEYEELNFRFDQSVKPDFYHSDSIGTTGGPNWIHNEDWPLCPKTGKKMQFLFQLGDIDESKTLIGQEILDKEYIDPYLHFGHGYLYIFYEPSSRVVAYLNQVS